VRPKTIVYFEWIIFGTIVLGVLQVYLGWDRIVQTASLHNSSVAPILIRLIFDFGLIGTLTLLVSRRRSKTATWVLIAWFALGLFGFLVQSITDGRLGLDVIMTAVGEIAEVVACGLLFTPTARRWMSREDEKLGEVVH
jgi:hypothetical protein